ncbi:MAG: DUF4892 domain-containing protein [Gammaproteobacteria bacterium]|nr:DUF4892 domain-containing protein [Gammaproteobacteria bacterium]
MKRLSRRTFSAVPIVGLVMLFTAEGLLAEGLLLEAAPRSSVVGTYSSEVVGPYDFIVAPVDRIRRDVSYERVIRVDGRVQYETYEISGDMSRNDAMDWYRKALTSAGGDVVFECEGRDCGRASIWGSSIFRQRVLSAVDSKQQYLAGALATENQTELFSIYVVERGNRRVYAHVVQVSVDGEVDLGTNQDFAETLARHGQISVEGVVPDRNGILSQKALDELKRLANDLKSFTEDIYVVCHVYGSRSPDLLLEQSKSCAESAAEAMGYDTGIEVIPFGAGPLAPLQGGIPQSRVEVVIPALLRREP